MTIHKKKCVCGHILDVEDAYQQGREDAIEDACIEVNRFLGYLDEGMIYRITLKLRQNCIEQMKE